MEEHKHKSEKIGEHIMLSWGVETFDRSKQHKICTNSSSSTQNTRQLKINPLYLDHSIPIMHFFVSKAEALLLAASLTSRAAAYKPCILGFVICSPTMAPTPGKLSWKTRIPTTAIPTPASNTVNSTTAPTNKKSEIPTLSSTTAIPTTASTTAAPVSSSPTSSPTTTVPTSAPANLDPTLVPTATVTPTAADDIPSSPPSASATPTPTSNPTTTIPTDCTKAICETQISHGILLKYQVNVPRGTTLEICDYCTISMEVVYQGEAWVGVAFSIDGKMSGSEAVIGIPGSGVPKKYHMHDYNGVVPMQESNQTLTNASVEYIDGQTIMKFTKIMKETGEIEITTGENKFLWAHGSSNELGKHASQSVFVLNLSSGSKEEVMAPNLKIWLAHGIMAFLAWAVFVPISVSAALFRDRFPKGPLWFNLHRNFNTASFSLLVVTFAIAVAYTTKEGFSSHFTNKHGVIGLIMLILTTVQMSFGLFRPSLTLKKTQRRKIWEYGHRFLGTLLLLCGFWQISSGIKLLSIKYSLSESNEGMVRIMYWAWVGAVTAIIVVGVWHSKVAKRVSNEPKCASCAVGGFDSGTRVQEDRTFGAEDGNGDEETSNNLACTPPMLDYIATGVKVKGISAFDITVDKRHWCQSERSFAV
ncbi:hypothetical protein ACHAXA_009921 [Cyclostephanos tholiformis]|uniref:Cytochrome b561 domain-containing protein n=1 Tax=Cyclostephanos tholiformis TaxID=382380 RepID=A0ABD3RY28_9STRA